MGLLVLQGPLKLAHFALLLTGREPPPSRTDFTVSRLAASAGVVLGAPLGAVTTCRALDPRFQVANHRLNFANYGTSASRSRGSLFLVRIPLVVVRGRRRTIHQPVALVHLARAGLL